MIIKEYQAMYGADLRKFLETPAGKEFLTTVGSMRPGYEFPIQEHLLTENRGAMRGYELCLRNAMTLTLIPIIQKEPEANYGVPDSKSTQ